MGQPVQGNRHNDATDRGSPVKIGGKASSSTPPAVADQDRVDAYFDTTGRLVVQAQNAAGGDIGGGTQYDEDTPHVTADKVTLAGVVQQTADAALSGDGDRSLLQVDGTGYLKVNVKAGSGAGVSHVDDAAFTPASDDVVPAAAMFDDVTPDSVDEGDAGVLRMSANRNLYTQIRDLSAERSAAVTAANALKVDGSTVTQPISGAVDTELPAAAALTDDVANPSAPATGSFPHGFDGTTWDRLRSVDGATTTPTAKTGVLAVGNGPGWSHKLAAGTLATAVNSTLEYECAGANAAVFHVSTTTTGNFAFEATADDSTWLSVKAWDFSDNSQVQLKEGAITPAANAVFVVPTSIWRKVRVRTTATLGTTVTFHRSGVTGIIPELLTAFTPISGIEPMLRVTLVDQNGDTVISPADNEVRVGPGGNPLITQGAVSSDFAVSSNPVVVGFRASTAIPAAVSADADAVHGWANRSGAPVVTAAPHVGLNSDPWNLVHEAAQYTTTQTSAVLVTGAAGEKIVVTKVQIQVGGLTAGTLQLYFGTGAYSRGTNRAIFDGEFAPSATLKPGVVMDGPFIAGTNGDDLMVTTSAALNPLTISLWYYVIT